MEYQIREENIKLEEEKATKQKINILVSEYFSNNNFKTLIGFLFFYVLIEILKFVENFYWVDLIAIISSVFVVIGLRGFYSEMLCRSSSNQSLGLTVISINILFVLSLVKVVISVFLLLPLIVKASFVLIILIALAGVMVINVQAYYYTSRCLSIIKDLVDDNIIRYNRTKHYFNKGCSKWLLTGFINAFIYLVSLLYNDYEGSVNIQNIDYKKIVNLGGFSKVIYIISIILNLIVPFIIATSLDAAKNGILNISSKVNEE